MKQKKKYLLEVFIICGITFSLFLKDKIPILFASEADTKYEESAQEELYAGIQLIRSNEYEQAIQQLKLVVEKYPLSKAYENALRYLADAYTNQLEYLPAIEILKELLSKHPERLSLYGEIIGLYEKTDQIKEIVQLSGEFRAQLEKSETLRREDIKIVTKLIINLLKRRELEDALYYCYFLLDHYPDDVSVNLYTWTISQLMTITSRYPKDDIIHQEIKEKIASVNFKDYRDLRSIAHFCSGVYPDLAVRFQQMVFENAPEVYGLPDEKILWAIATSGNVHISTRDIDGDGDLEIAICSTGEIYLIRGEDGKAVWRYPVEGVFHDKSLLTDCDGDSVLDVIALTGKVLLALSGSDGKLLWKFSQGDPHTDPSVYYGSKLLLGRFNSDDVSDVVIRTRDGFFAVDGKNGTAIWEVPHQKSSIINTVADLNGDGFDDVIGSIYKRGVLKIFNGHDGTLLQEFKFENPRNAAKYAVAKDVDLDGVLDVVFSYNGDITAFNLDKGKIWSVHLYDPTEHMGYGPPFDVVDLDADNKDEVVVVSRINEGTIFVLDSKSGEVKSTINLDHSLEEQYGFLDYNQDGYLDIAGVYHKDNKLRILSLKGAGAVLDEFRHFNAGVISGAFSTLPLIADFDADGKAEVAVSIRSILYVFRTPDECPKNAILWDKIR